jgi:hypothetical protein
VIEEFPYVNPELVRDVTLEAIRQQRLEEDRATLLDAVEAGEVTLYGRDKGGFHSSAVAGHRVARVHWTRLAYPWFLGSGG